MTLTDQIIETIIANPEMDSVQIGREAGCASSYVRAVARRRNHKFRKKPLLTDIQRKEIEASTEQTKTLAALHNISLRRVQEIKQETVDGRAPYFVLEERRRRQDALASLDLTGQLMGDPPPRRQHGSAGREDSL